MGMATRLYGCIVEYGLGTEEVRKQVYSHNEIIIENISSKEMLPFTKEMFSVNKSGYDYGGRIIHFGGNFRSIENSWNKWKVEFENLLTKLYWTEADVHFKTEYANIQTFTWRIDLKKWSLHQQEILHPIKPEYWDFNGEINWAK
jgi:hypothetical protein